MFDFFKRNKSAQPEIIKEEVSAPPAATLKEPVQVDNLAIHVMPERFRHESVKQDGAKNMGLLIIVAGIAVLLAAGVALYYFLFKEPDVVITQKPSVVAENNQPAAELAAKAPEILTATGTETATLPSDVEIATTTLATTTAETAPLPDFSLTIGADHDNDGLTDKEEILLGISSTTPDTDGDGYLDGAEFINLYNPAGADKLTANPRIALYENKTFAYDLLYPSAWQTSVNGGDDSLMFKTGDNQFIQVIVQPNVNKETLEEWYREQLDVLTISEAERVSGLNWQGLKTPDGLNIYLTDKKQNYIFSLTYNPAGADTLEYFNIFQMVVKSFNLKEP